MILSVRGIRFGYNGRVVLNDVSFEVNSGEICSVLGENGAGKTTLLKCMNRILQPKVGSVYIGKRDILRMKRAEIARHISYVPQRYAEERLTVFDAVLLGRKPYIKWDVSSQDMAIVEDTLRKMGLERLSLKYVDEISGGELQKVVIARALVQEPKVLLLDEPTNNLDIKNQIEMMKMVRNIVSERNISAVIAMHDINIALRYSHKFLMLKEGKVHACGSREIVTPKTIKEVYGVDVELVNHKDMFLVVPYN